MTTHNSRGRRSLLRPVLTALLLALCLTGCGGDGAPYDPGSGAAFGLSDPDAIDAATFGADRNVPIISVSRFEGRYTYRVHGEAKTESELFDLLRNLTSYAPDIKVLLFPSAGLSTKQVDAVEAKIRADGKVKNLVLHRPDGR